VGPFFLQQSWGIHTPYCYTVIIRGIGYRAFYLQNDFSTRVFRGLWGFIFNSYLVLRAGHTSDVYVGLPAGLTCYIIKKDRKLVFISRSKGYTNYLATALIRYRPPSVYTGRGLRTKKLAVIRKAGKKDKQKGKSF
jgi:ribosomal protein L6P/L9E